MKKYFSPKRVVTLIGLITLSILIVDGFLYTDDVARNSFTQVTIDYSKQYPIIPFLWGFLMGHFYG